MKKLIKLFALTGVLSLLLVACNTTTASYIPHIIDDDHDAEVLLTDWSDCEIVVNDRGIPNVSFLTIGTNNVPTHVPLLQTARELGESIFFENLHGDGSGIFTQEEFEEAGRLEHKFTLNGRNGHISFSYPTEDFYVDGETVTISGLPTIFVDGSLYVPIQFFTDVFGVGNAYHSNGIVFIYD